MFACQPSMLDGFGFNCFLVMAFFRRAWSSFMSLLSFKHTTRARCRVSEFSSVWPLNSGFKIGNAAAKLGEFGGALEYMKRITLFPMVPVCLIAFSLTLSLKMQCSSSTAPSSPWRWLRTYEKCKMYRLSFSESSIPASISRYIKRAFINGIGIWSFLIELKVHVGSVKPSPWYDIREGKGRAFFELKWRR